MKLVLSLVVAPFAVASAAFAAPPNLQTPSPVIYLKDNLDEKDRLGYCIDTVGRGQSDRAHLHSCKPDNGRSFGDVQFILEPETGHIKSETFENLCLEVVPTSDVNVEFHLSECANKPLQNFAFDTKTSEMHLADDDNICLAAGEESRSAGPFMARDLQLHLCVELEPALKQWVILAE